MRGLAVTLCVIGLAGAAQADVIGFEDFDGGAINLSSTSNVFDYGAGGGTLGDVFGRVSAFYLSGTGMPFDVADDSVANVSNGGVFAGDTRGIAGQYTTAFFALNDMDGPEGPGFTDATWTFDISSALYIDDITIDLAALGDFEAASLDGFHVVARIDADPYTEIFRGSTREDLAKVYRPMDIGSIPVDTADPLELSIDGVATGTLLDKCDPATGLFDSFVSTALAGGFGSTLDIQVRWEGTPSGSEPMGLDNITINGFIPEPASLLLLGVGALFLRRRR